MTRYIKSYSESQAFNDYVSNFIQRLPRYGVRLRGQWRTKNKPLSDRPIKAHLGQRYIVGGVGQWYPEFAVLDFDDVELSKVRDVSSELGLDDANSMLCSSESKDSYHLLFRPECNVAPPTLKLLQTVFLDYCSRRGIEIYPKANKFIRLPFGHGQAWLDWDMDGKRHLGGWEDKLYWFLKLDEYDLSRVPRAVVKPKLDVPPKSIGSGIVKEGVYLLEHGLQAPSSRNDAQFKIIYLLWRQNVPPDEVERVVVKWVRDRHNGFSKDIRRRPAKVYAEIKRQVERVYTHYDRNRIYPDMTHNLHLGSITKADIVQVVKLWRGSLPKVRFLYHLLKFYYPRRHRDSVNLHSKHLVEWGGGHSRRYLRRLRELKAIGLVERDRKYIVGKESKRIKLNWKFGRDDGLIYVDNRAPETLEDTIRAAFRPREFRELLDSAGTKRSWRDKILRAIFG